MTKIRLWENEVAYQETKQQRKAKQRKALLKEKEQKIEVREHNRIALAEAIKGAVTKF